MAGPGLRNAEATAQQAGAGGSTLGRVDRARGLLRISRRPASGAGLVSVEGLRHGSSALRRSTYVRLGPLGPATEISQQRHGPGTGRADRRGFGGRSIRSSTSSPRPGLPPLKAYWYDGVRTDLPASVKDKRNHPRLADELTKKYGRDLTNGGTLFVGEKGYIVSSVYSDGPRLVPEQKHKEFPPPKKKYARTRGIHADFLRACKEGGDPPSSNFPDVSGPYVEALLVGNLAMRAGVGKKVQWDGPNMKCNQSPRVESVREARVPQGMVLLY